MKPFVYLTLAAIMWGINFHLLKIMLFSVHFVEAGFWRYFFGVVALAFWGRKELHKGIIKVKHVSGILIVGILGLFGFNFLLFFGLNFTTPINASLIMSLNPLVTIFLALFFFKSKMNLKQMLGAVFGMVGVVYLLSRGEIMHLQQINLSKGDILVIVAMILSAFYHIWQKKYAVNISNKQFTLLTNFVCLLSFMVSLPFFIQTHPINYGMNFWMAAILMGVLGTALTYILWNKGLNMTSATYAGMFMNIVPLSTALISIVLGNKPETYHLISGLLILIGLMISQVKKNIRLNIGTDNSF